MTSELDLTLENLDFELEVQLEHILTALDEQRLEGEAIHALCATHRRLAIGRLLSALDLEGFRQQLHQSGRAYAFLLRGARQGYECDPYYRCQSRAEPFWDALAADDLNSAREIAAASLAPWQRSLEDESDHHYMGLMMQFLCPGEVSLEARLEAFQRSLPGLPTPRFEAGEALLRRDAGAFEAGLQALVDAYRRDFEELTLTASIVPEDAHTQAFVCIEAIGLLKLARLQGLAIPSELPLVPDVTLALPAHPFQENDVWLSLAPGKATT
jgi:hypothetical protein